MDNTQTLGTYTCSCDNVKELLTINYHWNHHYNVLLKKYKGLEDVQRKYHSLKKTHKETEEMLRSFEEAACIFSMADFEVLKNELISYKNIVDKEANERQALKQHTRNLERELEELSKKVELFASENEILKKDMKQIYDERDNLIDQIKKWIECPPLKSYPVVSICEKAASESFFQDTLDRDTVQKKKNYQMVESISLNTENCSV